MEANCGHKECERLQEILQQPLVMWPDKVDTWPTRLTLKDITENTVIILDNLTYFLNVTVAEVQVFNHYDF